MGAEELNTKLNDAVNLVSHGAQDATLEDIDDAISSIASSDAGNIDTLRNTVLSFVGQKKFKRAIRELREFESFKKSFPHFEDRSKRYFDQAEDVIRKLDEKQNIPGFRKLPASKQQEVFEQLHGLANQLKSLLKRIESIDNDLKVEDVRSTVWFLNTLMFCVFAICVVAFIKEGTNSMNRPVFVVIDDIVKLILSIFYEG